MRRCQLVIDDTGSVEGIYAFIYCTKWRSGQVLPMPHWLTHSLTTLKDSATQLLIKFKSGALVTQYPSALSVPSVLHKILMFWDWSFPFSLKSLNEIDIVSRIKLLYHSTKMPNKIGGTKKLEFICVILEYDVILSEGEDTKRWAVAT